MSDKLQKEQMESFFKEVFEADKAEMLDHVSGFTIKGVIELTNKDGDVMRLGLLEQRNG